ncbi:hypothetical protein [Oceanobacillus saliphilus]|uniref:hypothetical protein n=1 Tax=Oceanobacillus saliphilus TaxID=2925834 RepID=UPI00201D4FD7|nr:hypothetical protein [Oceanobacillus saliphilus]
MGETKGKFKMGWFGWTFISVITITIIISSLFFFNVFQLDMSTIFNDETRGNTIDEKDLTEEGREEVERVRSTIGQEHAEIGQFVSSVHDFYNKTTGYGGINNLDWDEQKEQSEYVINTIEDMKTDISDEALIADLESIVTLAQGTFEEEDSSNVRYLHRYFHDLDIALNAYSSYDLWNVTETLKHVE